MPRIANIILFTLGLLLATAGGYTYATTDASGVLPSTPQEGEMLMCPPRIDFGTMGRKTGSGAIALVGSIIASAALVSLAGKKMP